MVIVKRKARTTTMPTVRRKMKNWKARAADHWTKAAPKKGYYAETYCLSS
jgi:hypothetical protein